MRKRDIFTICIAWSLLIYIGYNVLTVEAATTEKKTGFLAKDYDWDEFYDDNVSRESVEKRCDASEDYEANEKACKKAYKYIEKQEQDSLKHIEEGREQEIKNICDKVDGKWTKDGCETDNDGPKADKFYELQDKAAAEKEGPIGWDENGRQLPTINGDYDEEHTDDEDPTNHEKTQTPITKYPDTEIKIEDWRNEVNPTEEDGYQIPSTTTVYENEEEGEEATKQLAQQIADNDGGDDSLERHNQNKNNYVEEEEEASEQEQEEESDDSEDEQESDDDSGGEEEESE